jgi:hypothetical protein
VTELVIPVTKEDRDWIHAEWEKIPDGLSADQYLVEAERLLRARVYSAHGLEIAAHKAVTE